jgi:putative sigma-54 modulation protein
MATTRKPLVRAVPRALKRGTSDSRAQGIPASIRVDAGVALADEERDYIRRRLGEKLGRYAASVERVSVRLRDLNGPRGGVDLQCRIKVVLSDLPSVLVEHQSTAFRPAFTAALTGAERAVRRALQRRRMRPIRVSR